MGIPIHTLFSFYFLFLVLKKLNSRILLVVVYEYVIRFTRETISLLRKALIFSDNIVLNYFTWRRYEIHLPIFCIVWVVTLSIRNFHLNWRKSETRHRGASVTVDSLKFFRKSFKSIEVKWVEKIKDVWKILDVIDWENQRNFQRNLRNFQKDIFTRSEKKISRF